MIANWCNVLNVAEIDIEGVGDEIYTPQVVTIRMVKTGSFWSHLQTRTMRHYCALLLILIILRLNSLYVWSVCSAVWIVKLVFRRQNPTAHLCYWEKQREAFRENKERVNSRIAVRSSPQHPTQMFSWELLIIGVGVYFLLHTESLFLCMAKAYAIAK